VRLSNYRNLNARSLAWCVL